MYLNERLGNPQEAIRYAEIAEPFIIEMHNDTYYRRHLVSWATECINANDIEKANQLMSKVESLLNHGTIEMNIGTLSNMGFVYLKSGKLERAISTIDKGIKLAINEKGEKCIELTTLYHNLGRAYMLKGDYSSALSALNKSKNLQLELEGEVMQRTADYIKECESK
jgi:tetratricopeptide (TPR) repeat protein